MRELGRHGQQGMKAALYARYSSDQQREASIEDQLRGCRELAAREGWTIAGEYRDAAMSGASMSRDGVETLLRDAARYDVVVTESLDRLSRNQEHIAGIFNRLSFRGIRIVTLQEGQITELHVGLKGTMNALYLKDLADKTRRGLRGRVQAGKSGGGNCYGYRVVAGKSEAGEREIVPAEAAIVVRICQEYAAGISPKAIARKLNAEGIKGPRSEWGPSTIYGHSRRGTGILNNELYIGRRVWNRQRYLKDPATGRRVSRPNPSGELTVTTVEALRIVSDELWNAVKCRQRETRHVLDTGAPLVRARRPKYLFSGLIKCGICESSFTMFSKDRLACAGATNRGTCSNTKSIRRDEVERRVLKAMEERLWNQELFHEFCGEFTRELNRLRGDQGAAITDARKELASVEAKASKCVKWFTEIWDGENREAAERMEHELQALERRRKELDSALEAAERSHRSRPLLHPEMGQTYRDWVIEARDALGDADRGADAMNALRAMVQEVTITPKAGELEILLKGDLAEMLVAAGRNGEAEDLRRQVKVVAGAGFEPATFGL